MVPDSTMRLKAKESDQQVQTDGLEAGELIRWTNGEFLFHENQVALYCMVQLDLLIMDVFPFLMDLVLQRKVEVEVLHSLFMEHLDRQRNNINKLSIIYCEKRDVKME